MNDTNSGAADYSALPKAALIKRALTNLGYVCKVRQHRFCVHIFLPAALRMPVDLKEIDALCQGIGMVPQFTPGRHLPTNIYSIQPMHEE